MTLNPRALGLELTPDARRAGRLSRMESRLALLERQALKGLQRGFDEETAEVSLTMPSPNALGTVYDLGGPSVTVQAEVNQLVLIGWEAEIKAGSGQAAQVVLYEPTDFPGTNPSNAAVLGFWEETTFRKGSSNARVNFASYFYDSFTSNATLVPMLAGFPVTTAGTKTYSLRYMATGNTTTPRWKNRRLWVVVV